MKIVSKSISKTLKIGRIIAKNLQKGDIICLFGELGSGKTVLTKGIAEGLGIKKNKIISPTFVLIREHKAGVPFYHFDLYRLKSPKEILVLGYEEYFYDDGITVVEWADRLRYLLPKECLKIELGIKTARQRRLRFIPIGERYKDLVKRIHEDIRR